MDKRGWGAGDGRGLAEAAISLAQKNVVDWLSDNSGLFATTFGPECTLHPVVGGSFVEGLLTQGSDLDLCLMVDGTEPKQDIGGLQDSFKRSISSLDGDLKELGLGGVCRISRRIRDANAFLELHRCQESKAAVMRTGVRMNYILSCRLLGVTAGEVELGVRIATGPMLTDLKKRLYQSYRRTLGYAHIPVLVHLLKRPGSYTPKRVATQVQVAVNDLLLANCGVESVTGELMDKISKVVDISERKRTLMESSRMKEELRAAIGLIRELKFRSATYRKAHRRSIKQLMSEGFIDEAQWELVKQLTRYLYERIS